MNQSGQKIEHWAFCDPGDLAYEPFAGSGTQIISAEINQRIAYGMEISPAYVDVAVKRWEAFTGKTAVRCANARTATEADVSQTHTG